ncbi:hypothetical protein PI124_g8485 [Phytophthora idaei]|nr:hypothetical protein PI125_g8860 [Phytophthora idaei]KAG3151448.1 hypothetical protein PI126_g10996 [Phytophthora idaei]KAG3246818.1 hypothetical protein PI124_g8485 [Phytophthora idaei]
MAWFVLLTALGWCQGLALVYVDQQLPCSGSVDVLGTDVPDSGNCLYHAGWVAAEYAGVYRPFQIPT